MVSLLIVTNAAIKRPAEEEASPESRDSKKGKTDTETLPTSPTAKTALGSLHFNKVRTQQSPPPASTPTGPSYQAPAPNQSSQYGYAPSTSRNIVPTGPSRNNNNNNNYNGNNNNQQRGRQGQAEVDTDFDMEMRRRGVLGRFDPIKGFGFVRMKEIGFQSG